MCKVISKTRHNIEIICFLGTLTHLQAEAIVHLADIIGIFKTNKMASLMMAMVLLGVVNLV